MRCENCYDTVTEMIAAKDAEIARLNDVVAAMTETADEANRSYIEHHNTIESLRTQLADATRKLEEARKDADMLDWLDRECIQLSSFSMPTAGGDDASYGWTFSQQHQGKAEPVEVYRSYKEDLREAIKEAIEQGKGGDDVY